MTYNELLNQILEFEWNNVYDRFKHWNYLHLYTKSESYDTSVDFKTHNDPFRITVGNSIEEFYYSDFGFKTFDITIQDGYLIATDIDGDYSIIKVQNPKELMLEINNSLCDHLINIANEDDETKEWFNQYGYPMRIAKTLSVQYSSIQNTWTINDVSMLNDNLSVFQSSIFADIRSKLNEYCNKHWTEEFIDSCLNVSDLPAIEKQKLFKIIEEVLIKWECLDDHYSLFHENGEKKFINIVFDFN